MDTVNKTVKTLLRIAEDGYYRQVAMQRTGRAATASYSLKQSPPFLEMERQFGWVTQEMEERMQSVFMTGMTNTQSTLGRAKTSTPTSPELLKTMQSEVEEATASLKAEGDVKITTSGLKVTKLPKGGYSVQMPIKTA
jgi:hypothetical protein